MSRQKAARASAAVLLRKSVPVAETRIEIPSMKGIRQMWYQSFNPEVKAEEKNLNLENLNLIFRALVNELKEDRHAIKRRFDYESIRRSNGGHWTSEAEDCYGVTGKFIPHFRTGPLHDLPELPTDIILAPVMVKGFVCGAVVMHQLETIGHHPEYALVGYSHHNYTLPDYMFKNGLYTSNGALEFLKSNNQKPALIVDEWSSSGKTMHTIGNMLKDIGFKCIYVLTAHTLNKLHPDPKFKAYRLCTEQSSLGLS